MSEYQYYEFQAIDRPLTGNERSNLRSCSTRATITPTSFVNVYNWGDFKGDPLEWMEKYFDAFVYLSNWGTRMLMIRVPASLFNEEQLAPYTGYETFVCHRSDDNLILQFDLNDEDGGDWVEGEGWLQSMIGVRSELMSGDHRALYLGWLLAVQEADIDNEEPEPPVPAGLKELSESSRAFSDFFYIDQDLIAVAAENSPDLESQEPSASEVESWLETLPIDEKDNLLSDFINGNRPHLSAELKRRIIAETRTQESVASVPRRTAGELLAKARRLTQERERAERERNAREKAEREKRAALERKNYLQSLKGKESELWNQVEQLIQTRQPKRYDEAVVLLADLQEVAALNKKVNVFQIELQELTERHSRKGSLLKRIQQSGGERRLATNEE